MQHLSLSTIIKPPDNESTLTFHSAHSPPNRISNHLTVTPSIFTSCISDPSLFMTQIV